LLEISKRRDVDCLIIGGDLVPRDQHLGNLKEKIQSQRAYLEGEFIPEVERFKEKNPDVKIFLDMGNDDFAVNRDVLEQREGKLFHLLHMAKHPLTEEADVLGYMCVPPTPFFLKDWEKPDARDVPVISDLVEISGVFTSKSIRFGDLDLSSEDTIEKDMDALSDVVDRPFIFVSHSPPYGTDLDILSDGVSHVGSRAIRQFIEHWTEKGSLIATFHGHIHEAAEVSGKSCWMAGGIPSFNPGQTFGELQYVIFELP
jgi:Icc-related predicted phosphoesterase